MLAGVRGGCLWLLALTVGLLGSVAVAFAGSAVAAVTTVAFTTQGCTTWTVPTGVGSVQIQAIGAAGGGAGGGAGGVGDGVSGAVSSLAGGTQVLDVCVDQGGGGSLSFGGGGGGASGVSLGSDFSSPVLVGGGGGGGGGFSNGAGGGSAGMPVAGVGGTARGGSGGGGGNNTTAMGGAGGSNGNPTCNGGAGGQSGPAGPGSGGIGGGGNCFDGGGGGGGGYFGGGGGSGSGFGGGGGGGGTDFCADSIVSCTVSSGPGTQTMAGAGTGDAQLTITYALTSTGVSAPGSAAPGTAIAAGWISATLSGASSAASGTITFTVFGPQSSPPTDCTSGGTTVGTAAVSDNGIYHPSAGFTPASLGTYWWYASYSGDDGANQPSNSGCGTGITSTVVKDATSASVSAPASGTAGTVTAAGSISGILSGATSGAGGTITFKVFGPQSSPPSDCSSGGTTVGTAAVSSNGTYHPSGGFTPPSAGTYWWYASYGGDGANQPSDSGCGTGMTSTVVNSVVTSTSMSVPPAPPSATVSSPANGARYTRGRVVPASYACRDGARGPGIASCTGPVSSGQAIDTSTVGRHTFLVTATSKDGQTTTSTSVYTVQAPNNHFTVSRIKTHRNGSITFTVKLPGAGAIDVLETAWKNNLATTAVLLQPATRRFVIARRHTTAPDATTLKLRVRPNKQGKRLIRRHAYRVTLRLWVSYTPTGGRFRKQGFYGLHLPR